MALTENKTLNLDKHQWKKRKFIIFNVAIHVVLSCAVPGPQINLIYHKSSSVYGVNLTLAIFLLLMREMVRSQQGGGGGGHKMCVCLCLCVCVCYLAGVKGCVNLSVGWGKERRDYPGALRS